MSDFIGATLLAGLAWFAIEAFGAGKHFMTLLFVIAMGAVLYELLRRQD